MTLPGCSTGNYAPEMAADSYPAARHTAASVDIQFFRDGPTARIQNATVNSYRGVRLWLNQRYVRAIPDLPAGGLIEIGLDEFYDDLGERMIAGGFFRTERTTPIVLAELEVDGLEPLVGIEVIGPVFDGR